MAEYQFVDELVKEYLTFRGFTSTLKSFEQDLRSEKEKGFRVDRVIESLNQSIISYDLNSLLEIWKHFENNIFSKIDPSKANSVRKLEASLLKLYLINCLQNRQSDKVKQFFEKMTPELQNASEWKEWFALPFIKDPQENQAFLLYFTRNWQDTVMISLHNFLMICFQSLPPPRLADCQKTAARVKYLKEEIRNLKLKLAKAGYDEDPNLGSGNLKYYDTPAPLDIMDDFFLIAQETEKRDTQVRSIRSFLKTFTGQKKSPGSQSQGSVPSVQQQPLPSVTQTQNPTKPKHPISINKVPLKRISPSLANLSLPKSVAAKDIELTAATEQPTAAARPSSLDDEESSDDKNIGMSRTRTMDLLATPGTPANQLLLLGQEEYHEHRSSVVNLQVSISGLTASADVSGVIKIWKPEASSHLTTTATFISGSPVSCLVWLDERRLLYGTNKGQVRMCDAVDKCLIQESGSTPLSGQPISVLCASPVENLFLAASTNTVLILSSKEFKTLSVEKEIDTPEVTNLTGAVYNHNGALIIFSTNHGSVGIYDLHRDEVLSSWQGHDRQIVGLQLTPDETSVWSLDRSGMFLQSSLLRPGTKLWRGSMPELDCELVGDFALSPSGDHVLVGSATGALVYRIENADSEGEGDSTFLPSLGGGGFGGEGEGDKRLPKRGNLVKVLGMKAETTITTVHWSSGDCGILLAGGMDGSIKISTLLHQ